MGKVANLLREVRMGVVRYPVAAIGAIGIREREGGALPLRVLVSEP